MHGIANQSKRSFQIAIGSFKGVGIDCEWSTEHN